VTAARRFAMRIRAGVIWAMFGSLISQGAGFANSIIAARLLGGESFGRLAVVQTAVTMLAAFSALGLGATATKFVAELRTSDPVRAGRVLGLCSVTTLVTGAIFAAIMTVGAPRAEVLFNASGVSSALRVGAFSLLFLTLNSFQVGAMAGFDAFRVLARIGFVQGILSTALTAGLTRAFGLTGAVLALSTASFASWLQHHWALRRECEAHGIVVRYDDILKELRLLANFAVPAALSGCIGGIAVATSNAFVVRQPLGLLQMATFNAANNIRTLTMFVPTIVSRVSAPLLVREKGAGDAYRTASRGYLVLNTIITTAAAAGLFSLLELYGKDFTGGRAALAVLLLAAVVETVAVALFQTLYAHGRIWTQAAIASSWGLVLCGVSYLLAARYGAVALAGAYLAAWVVAVIPYAVVARRIMRTSGIADGSSSSTREVA
jgi:O-antigen/teichoic acid export membrane protein